MEFYSLYLKNCMFVTNKVCGKVNENKPGSDLFLEGAMGGLGGWSWCHCSDECWGGHPVALQGHAGCHEGVKDTNREHGVPYLVLGELLDSEELGVCSTSTVGREKVWHGLGMLCHSLGWCVHGYNVWVCVKCV